MKHRVLITNAVPDDILKPLCGLAEVVQGPSGGDLMSREAVLRLAPSLDAIINQAELRVDEELLNAAPRLRIVANVAIGTDNLEKDLMAAHGVWATNTPGVFDAAAADATLGLILCAARRLCEADRYVRSNQWRGFQPGLWDGVLLEGKTLGIVGYGAIGKMVAIRARAFGMRVIYTRRTRVDDAAYRPMETLLAESDFVSLHTPLNSDSHHLIDAAALQRMKRGAYLINMARGKVVDEVALVEALQSGHLAGAALDVFENEPQVHPALREMPHVALSPHLGGGTHQSRHASRLLCAKNVARVLQGEAPLTPVNQPTNAQLLLNDAAASC